MGKLVDRLVIIYPVSMVLLRLVPTANSGLSVLVTSVDCFGVFLSHYNPIQNMGRVSVSLITLQLQFVIFV
jgi:hypothetical protein